MAAHLQVTGGAVKSLERVRRQSAASLLDVAVIPMPVLFLHIRRKLSHKLRSCGKMETMSGGGVPLHTRAAE